jgi:hypothetical protein
MSSLQELCRVGDQGTGVCWCTDGVHTPGIAITTTFTNGSVIATADGKQVCIVNLTKGQASCTHHTIALTGSGLCGTTEGEFHRVGDTGTIIEDTTGRSYYTATTGSPTTSCM